MKWILDKNILEQYTPVLNRLAEKKSRLDACRPLPTYILEKIKHELSLEWTYHSNSIEGNTLSLNETRIVLENGMTIKGKSLREHFEVVNHYEAIDFITGLAGKDFLLSEADILEVHSIVMTRIEKNFAGRYRNGGVRIGGANFIPPNALKVPVLMSDLVQQLRLHSGTWPILYLATVFHHAFVYIHPFFDGNGRTVRLLMNALLLKEGYPPAIILQQDRKKYYDALNQANKGNYDKLFLLILQAVERSLNIYLHVLPTDSPDDDYALISDIASEPDTPYGQEYISLLARKGLIDAYKEGRNWLTRRSAVMAYKAQHQPKVTLGSKKK